MHAEVEKNSTIVTLLDVDTTVEVLEEMRDVVPEIQKVLNDKAQSQIEAKKLERNKMNAAIISSNAIERFSETKIKYYTGVYNSDLANELDRARIQWSMPWNRKTLATYTERVKAECEKGKLSLKSIEWVKFNSTTGFYEYRNSNGTSTGDNGFCAFVDSIGINWVGSKIDVEILKTTKEDLDELIRKVRCVSADGKPTSSFPETYLGEFDFKFKYEIKTVNYL